MRVLRDTDFSEMKVFAFLSLTLNFNIKFQYIKTCIPSKIPRRGGWGVQEGLGMDKIMGFYISPHLMFSITFISLMHFHNHLCISISPKILKEIFAACFPMSSLSFPIHPTRLHCLFYSCLLPASFTPCQITPVSFIPASFIPASFIPASFTLASFTLASFTPVSFPHVSCLLSPSFSLPHICFSPGAPD